MVRRSPPQRQLDERAFPVRVKVAEDVCGPDAFLLADAQIWLKENIGAGDYATHSQPGYAGHTRAFYFRTVEAAQRFLDQFPRFNLFDTTHLLDHLQQAKEWAAAGRKAEIPRDLRSQHRLERNGSENGNE